MWRLFVDAKELPEHQAGSAPCCMAMMKPVKQKKKLKSETSKFKIELGEEYSVETY
jgi:hypothetical protein